MPLQITKVPAKQTVTIDHADAPIVISLNPPFKANASYTFYYFSPTVSDSEKLPITLSQSTPQYTFPSQFITTNPSTFSIQNSSEAEMILCVQVQDVVKATAVQGATKRKAIPEDNTPAVDEVKKDAKKQKTAAAEEKPAPPIKSAEDREKQRQTDEANAPVKQLMKLPNGLQYKDEELGRGPGVTKGQVVAVRYQGMLTDGRIFDSNMPKGHLLTFAVGAGEVVAGFEQGVIGMKIGGKRRVIIPPHLGYGRQASGPIPPNSTLVFDITLVK